MRVLLATDTKFYLQNERIYATEKMGRILPRYYNSFGKINLLARQMIEDPHAELTDITDMLESVLAFKNFYELYSSVFKNKAEKLAQDSDLIVGRFEGFSAIYSFKLSKMFNIPFFGEVMSDPWDGLWNHGIMGKIVAPYSYFSTKVAMTHADYGLYVTNEFLQRRYPCMKPTAAVSNVYIEATPVSVLENRISKIGLMDLHHITLTTTAATYVRYKGQEYVIKAIPILNSKGIRVKYNLIGEGSQEYLKGVARKYNVEDQVVFHGRLSMNHVILQLDSTDIYIQPSLQEGLPRAVIEAMSRGCPCLGTKTGGIPELIQSDTLFKRKSAQSIADTIIKILDKNFLVSVSKQNFEKSKLFLDEILCEKRTEYYKYVLNDLKQRKAGDI